MIIGLTGGIGSGKSAAASVFKDLGIDLIDADDLARDSLNINSKGYKLFINEFGEKYLDENKDINRELLRKDIFNDPATKIKLENIIHPFVRSGIQDFINSSKSDYCIIVVPLIYETANEPQPVEDIKTITRNEPKVGRNDIVKISNGKETKEIKFKKAQPLINTGDWKII